MLLLRRLRRLRWAAARAGAMSPPEVAWRVRTALRARVGSVTSLLAAHSSPASGSHSGVGDRMLFGSHPLHFLPAEDLGRADLRQALATLPALPARDPLAASARDWNRDPETG